MARVQPYDDDDHKVLGDDEINAFFDDIDTDKDGFVTIEELEDKLEHVHMELAPQPKSHHLTHPERRFLGREKHESFHDEEKGHIDPEHDGLMEFLQVLLAGCDQKIGREAFCDNVRKWNIPSQNQDNTDDDDAADAKALHNMGLRRRWRAWWSVKGHKVAFIFFVAALTIALSVWQGVKYILAYDIRAALGWGVIMAKFCAGALYPVMFFLLLSMSRIWATFMRRFYHISRFVNWDRSQSFHIWMACIGLTLATLHAVGHLTGTFLTGSQPDRQPALAALGLPTPKSYADFASSLPGWTGIASLSMFWVLSLLSMPVVRRWSYETFQLGHLLMFPMMGLLSAHGVAQILGQYPMLGFWLVFPGTLIIIERCQRIIRGFIKIPTRLEVLDDDTVTLTCKQRHGKNWRYAAGQYVFLQVPALSWLQWHPFTISACHGDKLQLHIKTDGDWTSKLRHLPQHKDIFVGIDGPYGAPAQRFYDFNKSLIIGSGVGITPFSAIITDIEQHLTKDQDPWARSRRGSTVGSRRSSRSRITSHRSSTDTPRLPLPATTTNDSSEAADHLATMNERQIEITEPIKQDSESSGAAKQATRRVDFHWMVREKNYLLWFSSLLNRATDLAEDIESGRNPQSVPLDLNINTHITAKRKSISTHVFRYLLDSYRTQSAPYSALTGLKTRSHFGRPNLARILADFHAEMLQSGVRNEKVGVFFCGSPVIGEVLADTCWELTAKSRHEGSNIRYVFMMEVFG